MINNRLRTAFLENPEFLLALSLSAPAPSNEKIKQTLTLTFDDEDVVLRAERPQNTLLSTRIASTKQTIAAAILMHHVLSERGPDYVLQFLQSMELLGDKAAYRDSEIPLSHSLGLNLNNNSTTTSTIGYLREMLDVSGFDCDIATNKTIEALDFLEFEGLAIDPGFTPDFMVLLGLVPMQFSIRTPKGERIYKEIKIGAPLWSLDIKRGQQKNLNFTDVDFRFRGIEIVRNAITGMASQYLDSEQHIRKSKGKPTIPRKGRPSLDDE